MILYQSAEKKTWVKYQNDLKSLLTKLYYLNFYYMKYGIQVEQI